MGPIARVDGFWLAPIWECVDIVRRVYPDDRDRVEHDLVSNIHPQMHSHALFVYYACDAIRGFIKGHIEDSGVAWGDWLFVDPAFQGRGVGLALINAYEEYCRGFHVSEISVKSAATVQALRFYTNRGYEMTDPVNFIMTRYLGRGK